jgi:hypothetical protein
VKTILVGKNEEPVVVDDDFVQPPGYSLNVNDCGYVRMLKATGERRPSGSYVYEQDYLSRWIMGAPKGKVIIYLDRNKLNLQRDNMIVCDRAVSIRSTGGRSGRFKGVHFSKKSMKWIAQITCNYKCYSLGSFDTDEAAASAYNAAAVRLYGAHAYINYMPEDQ